MENSKNYADSMKQKMNSEKQRLDSLNGKIVIDAWRMLDYKKYKGIKKYIPIGINEF